MKKTLLAACLFVLALAPALSCAEAPLSIVGISLGSNIEEAKDMVDMSSALPVWGSEYLSQVCLKPLNGYQSGYVVYGNCKVPGRIVRIKLNYLDDSEEFFEKLRSNLIERYGKPREWRGNPFGTLKVWKWSVGQGRKSPVSIVLQHYDGDDDSFSEGNSIKISLNKYLEEEKECHKLKAKGQKPNNAPRRPEGKLDFNWYLPK
jgi:hypothetical protein